MPSAPRTNPYSSHPAVKTASHPSGLPIARSTASHKLGMLGYRVRANNPEPRRLQLARQLRNSIEDTAAIARGKASRGTIVGREQYPPLAKAKHIDILAERLYGKTH